MWKLQSWLQTTITDHLLAPIPPSTLHNFDT
jgi:hypothetical protein